MKEATFNAMLLCVCIFGSSPKCEAKPFVRFAIIVGNNVGLPNESPLRYAESEAKKVSRTLLQLGKTQVHNMVLLLGKTPKALWRNLQIIQQRTQRLRAKAHVTLFFYYSGHGSRGALHMGKGKLPVKMLKKRLHQTGAQTVIAFLDACHSGSVIRRKGFKRRPKFKILLEKKPTVQGRIFISSSGEFEASLESDDVQGSYFTHFLLSGMRGQADRNKDGRVDIDELYQYTYHRTVARTSTTKRGTQHPSFDIGIRGKGRLVLTWPKQSKSGLFFGPSLSGSFLILSRYRKELIAEVSKQKGKRAFIALAPQSYLIQKRTSKGYYVAEINLTWGGKKTFNSKSMRFISYSQTRAKGMTTHGPPHKLLISYELRTGVIAGNAFLMGVGASYKQRNSSSFVWGASLHYHTGKLVSIETSIPTHSLGAGLNFSYRRNWQTLSFDVGGTLIGEFVWQQLRPSDFRTSPAFRIGPSCSLRWLFAQPWAFHLQLFAGIGIVNVGGSIRPSPFFQASIGPALWW